MNEATEARLTEIGNLEAGWLDETGMPVPAESIAKARMILEALELTPRVYPVPNGGIQIVFGEEYDVEFEVWPDGKISAWVGNASLVEQDDE